MYSERIVEELTWGDLRVWMSPLTNDIHIWQDDDHIIVTASALEEFIAALRKVATDGKPETEEAE